ncbi:DNA replication protein DnaC [Clostridia bacterium]|nr:DNA replication protein DnaC [Clostridia bacterium]
MSYSEKSIEAALEQLALRRKKTQDELQEKKNAVYEHVPKLKALESRMTSLSLTAIKKVANGAEISVIEELKLKNMSLQKEKERILKENEIPEDYLKISYVCSTCKDTGYVKNNMCDCLKRLVVKESAKSLNMKTSLDRFSFENFEFNYFGNDLVNGTKEPITQKEQARLNYDFCVNYAKKFSMNSGNILMQGGTGLGKTHLSLAIAKSCLGQGYSVVYALAGQVVYSLEDERFGRGEQKDCSMDSFLRCDLLIIDDFGSEPQNQFALAALYNIINSRLIASKPTIINTNLTGAEITAHYGERVSSRLFGEYQVLRAYGEDIRLQKRGKTHPQK